MFTPLSLQKLTLLVSLYASLLISSSSSSSVNDYNLVNVSKLEMFVDELLDMPRIHGYKLVHGQPKPNFLPIGMFHKNWVRSPSFHFFLLYIHKMFFFLFSDKLWLSLNYNPALFSPPCFCFVPICST